MVWIVIILVLVIAAAIRSTRKTDNYTKESSVYQEYPNDLFEYEEHLNDLSEYEEYPNDLSAEEIEYDYLQRMEEIQDEEDYYLQQMDDE
jgi:hypothetical protein